jgi:hypothetical protein
VGKWHLEHRPSGFDKFAVFVKQGSYQNPHLVWHHQARNCGENSPVHLLMKATFSILLKDGLVLAVTEDGL